MLHFPTQRPIWASPIKTFWRRNCHEHCLLLAVGALYCGELHGCVVRREDYSAPLVPRRHPTERLPKHWTLRHHRTIPNRYCTICWSGNEDVTLYTKWTTKFLKGSSFVCWNPDTYVTSAEAIVNFATKDNSWSCHCSCVQPTASSSLHLKISTTQPQQEMCHWHRVHESSQMWATRTTPPNEHLKVYTTSRPLHSFCISCLYFQTNHLNCRPLKRRNLQVARASRILLCITS